MGAAKTLFESKTIWFGIFQICFGGIGMLAGFLDTQTGTGLIMTGLGTIGLRLKTSQPISGVLPPH